MATSMATSRAKAMAMAMAVAICRATWMEKTDGGKGNGNIAGKKHWQIRGGGKSTGGKFNGKIWVASKSPWQHTRQRKGKLALRAKAIATQVAKLWQKLWQGLKTGPVSGKSRWHIAWRILYAAVGLHKRLLKLCHVQSKWTFSIRLLWCRMIKLSAQKLLCLQFTWSAIAFRLCFCLMVFCV